MGNPSKSKATRRYAVAVVFIGLICAVFVLRKQVNGLHNLLSPKYWAERVKGEDLYNPQEALFKRGSRSYKEVVLTIDDGPHKGSMDTILDVLKREHVHATFFVVGLRVKQAPELVKRMLDEGHEVGNHTQDHLRLDTLSSKALMNEITNCETNVERATGHSMTLFRPPGMRFTPAILQTLKSKGYTTVDWNIGAKDFLPSSKGQFDPEFMKMLNQPPSVIADRVLKQLQNGSIILLHDNPVTAAALPMVIDRVKAEGYEFRTTAQMLEHVPNAPPIVANPVYTAARVRSHA